MPRAFTLTDLTTLTQAEVEALSAPSRAAFHLAFARAFDLRYPWHIDDTAPPVYLEDYIQGDYDLVGSNRRFELGE